MKGGGQEAPERSPSSRFTLLRLLSTDRCVGPGSVVRRAAAAKRDEASGAAALYPEQGPACSQQRTDSRTSEPGKCLPHP